MTLIEKIRRFFNIGPLDYTEYLLRVNTLSNELAHAKERINSLSRQLEEKTKNQSNLIFVSGFDDLSHEPTDAKERERYASEVSDFYERTLKAKIRTSIAEVRESLAALSIGVGLPQNMTREQYDFTLRGMEAGFWKIHEWATILQGELKNK